MSKDFEKFGPFGQEDGVPTPHVSSMAEARRARALAEGKAKAIAALTPGTKEHEASELASSMGRHPSGKRLRPEHVPLPGFEQTQEKEGQDGMFEIEIDPDTDILVIEVTYIYPDGPCGDEPVK